MVKIYTGFGDRGSTRLFGGKTVLKDDIRIELMGTLDELNCHLGLISANEPDNDISKIILGIQNDIFELSAAVASWNACTIDKQKINYLEEIIDIFNNDLQELKNFILPGGTERAAQFHVARSVCRRAERQYVTMMRIHALNDVYLIYLNRLSDLLFVLARIENKRSGVSDSIWSSNGE